MPCGRHCVEASASGAPLFLARIRRSSTRMYSGFNGGGTPGSGPSMYSYPSSHQTPSRLRGSELGGAEPGGAALAPRKGGVRARVGSPLLRRVLGGGAGVAAALSATGRTAVHSAAPSSDSETSSPRALI